MNSQQDLYDIIYFVTYMDNLHLGEYEANKIATNYAIKATWLLFNDSHNALKFHKAALDYIQNT